MIDRELRRTLRLMAVGMFIAFLGIFVYAVVQATLGYAISMVGIAVMGIGIALNIGVHVSRHRKNRR